MKTIYLVPHSHYDVVWAFNKEDYLNINETILTYALDMIKNSGFKFLIEQTYPLEQLERREPEFFAEVRDAIASGQIEVVDGCYIMPDLMIPSGETLLREFLVGNRYCKKKFGIDIPVAYAADTFGLNAQMPQIYRKSGYKWLVFRRGLPKLIGRKVSEFIWEGIDGSQIIAHWLPMGYRAGLDLDKWEESVQKLSELATTDVIFMPCGSGGTPPQEEVPRKIEEWNESHQDSQIIIATPRQFFEHFEKSNSRYLPIFRGELYSADLEDVFPDVVSSRMSLKLAIEESERMLLLAEKLATLAMLEGKAYPLTNMTKMWKEMLFLANHDVLPSCGIDEIYEEAWEYVENIRKTCRKLIFNSAQHIVKEKEDGSEVCVAVFNPYTWTVTDWVEAELDLGKEWQDEPGLMLNGKVIASEILDARRRKDGTMAKAKIGFIATERPMNHQVFQVCKKNSTFENKIEVDDSEVLTEFFRLRIDKKTGILQVHDNDGVKLVEGNEIIIDQELGDLYFHRHQLDEYIGSESGKGIRFGIFKPEEGVDIDQGPLKTSITYKSTFYCLRWPYYLTEKFGTLLHRQKTLDLVKKVTVYNDLPRLDFETYLNLHQTHVRIRLKFDSCMITPEYWRQTQFGALEIPPQKVFEEGVNVPAPDWVTAQEGDRGIAFMTLGVPVNEIRAGEIYYTLLRSVSVLSSDGISGPLIPTPGALEVGEHTYKYSVYPYRGDWRDAGIYKSALKFEQSLLPVQINSSVNKKYESFSLTPDNLIISALKVAEEDKAVILRFFEAKGEKCRGIVKFPSQIKKVMLVNLLELEESEIQIGNNTLELDVGPFEIVTLKLFTNQ